MKRLFIHILIVVTALTSYYFFGQKSFSAPQRVDDLESITLGVSLGDYDILPFIAEEQGYFAKEGLDVEMRQYDAGLYAVSALVAGDIDIATAEDFVLTNYSFEHENLDTLGTIAFGNHEAMIARKDHSIEKPYDLKGKKIGVTAKTKSEYFLWRFLIARNIEVNEVSVSYLDPEQIEEAIIKGTIDAASIGEPYASAIKKRLGKNAIRWSAEKGQYFYYLLISNKKWLDEHPKQAERLLRALIKAEEYLQKSEFTVTLPQELLLVMEEEARWIIRHKQTETFVVPNYLNHIYFKGLKALKPERISIIH